MNNDRIVSYSSIIRRNALRLLAPYVLRELDAPYEKGVKVCGNEKIELEQWLQRSTVLSWWDITI